MRNSVYASIASLCTLPVIPGTAHSYPIDCAILLCLAGGFPSSAECTSAKVEMIRRITPFPVEPPLQLWNCPMAGAGGAVLPGVGSDGLTADIRSYRDGIEIYHIDYRQSRGGGDTNVVDRSKVGLYSEAGDFAWHQATMREAPDWIFDETGVSASAVRNQIGTIMRWRGILMRWRNYQGTYTTEWVSY